MKQKLLFIDRDGTLNLEPDDEQLDCFEKLVFYPGVFTYLGKIFSTLDYKLVMVTNQDGLGTESFPEVDFWPVHDFIIQSFKNEGIAFEAIHIDRTFPYEQAATRKPRTGLLTKYIDNPAFDLTHSWVIGDRLTDMELAKNLGCRGIFINNNPALGAKETTLENLNAVIGCTTTDWKTIYTFLKEQARTVKKQRHTNETQISLALNLDGTGQSEIHTGIAFFDHMLAQLSRHGQLDLTLHVQGDLDVDTHHTIEDTAIVLGEAVAEALGNKKGIERYGFCLPMDDCLAQVALDFGGRNWLVWDALFKREKIGAMPTEMFFHFFKSFSDGAKANVNIKAEGTNEHHKIEAIFKAFAKAIKMAVKRDPDKMLLPTTKGLLS